MRVTITPASRPQAAFSLVDGSPLNTWPVLGEVFGLESGGLDGWKNGVAPRYEAPEIPGQDGSYAPDEVLLSSRVVTIRGFYAARRPASSLGVAAFEDLIASLIGEWLTVEVEDSTGTRSAEGFVSAIPVNTRLSEHRLKFTLIVLCTDPLKYGAAVPFPVTGRTVTVENTGTGRVFPWFVVEGPVTVLDVRAGGYRVRWVGDAVDLTLDLRDAMPLSGGFETGTLVFAEVFRLPPGTSTLAVDCDGDLTIGVAPGWK